MGTVYLLDFTKRGVDLDKAARGRHRDRGGSGLDWMAYNATRIGVDHPKGSDGRFVDGHPSVAALGDMPDFAHRLSDADLKRAKQQNQSLASAIAAEEKRRAAPAKPLKAAKPKITAKPIPAELVERVKAIQDRPLDTDRAYLEKELPKLTLAQLQTLPGGDSSSENKARKVESITRVLLSRLASEAVTHQSSARGREHELEYRRRRALATERGDREEYAALVAGFGIGGTGPGLPPEKIFGGIREATDADRINEGAPLDAAAKRERAQELASQSMINSNESRARLLEADRLVREAEQAEAGTKAQAKRAAKPLKAKKADPAAVMAEIDALVANPKTEADRGSKHIDNVPVSGEPAITKPLKADPGRIAAKDLSTAMAEIDALVANPKTERDRDRVKNLLSRMTLAQMKQVADKHHSGLLVGANKDEKVRRLADSIVGTKLDSAAIDRGVTRGSSWVKDEDVARYKGDRERTEAAFAGGSDKLKNIIANPQEGDAGELTRLLEEMKVPALRALGKEHGFKVSGTKKEIIDSLVDNLVDSKLNSRAIRASVSDALDVGGTRDRAFGGNTGAYLDTPPRTSGDGQFYGNHYHGDGNMGQAIEGMTDKQRSINIGGKRLDDALADVIIMGHSGEKGISARQVDEWKRIASEAEAVDIDAARQIRRALAEIAKPSDFRWDAAIKPGTPEPVVQLMRDIDAAAANRFEPDEELKQIAGVIDDFVTGKIGGSRFINAIGQAARQRHESQEGFFEIRQAVKRAVEAMEAMQKANRTVFHNGGR